MGQNKGGGGDFAPSLSPRFAIGTPGSPSPRMLQSVMAMLKPPGTHFINASMSHPVRKKLDIATARNGLVEQFLTIHERAGMPEPLKWLLQVDGDCVAHPMTLQRLQSWNRAVVGALCVTRYRPFQPVVYRGLHSQTAEDMRSYYVQWKEVKKWIEKHPKLMNIAGFSLLNPAPEDSLHEVDFTGSHCFLVHRDVFEKIPPPWFENATNPKYGSGSDRIFFEKVRAAGFTPYVDYSVCAGHEATVVLGMGDFIAWQSISIDEQPKAVEHYVGDDTVVSVDEKDADWYDNEFLDHPHFSREYVNSPWYKLWVSAIDVMKQEGSKQILDLGCGPGQVAAAIKDSMPELQSYKGLDFSEERIRRAAEVFDVGDSLHPPDLAVFNGRFGFLVRDVYNWDWHNWDYDTVLMTEFLEHVTRDLEIIEQVWEGALVVATVPDFMYEGHVRAFSSSEDVRNRYGHLFNELTVEAIPRPGGNFFLFHGRRNGE